MGAPYQCEEQSEERREGEVMSVRAYSIVCNVALPIVQEYIIFFPRKAKIQMKIL